MPIGAANNLQRAGFPIVLADGSVAYAEAAVAVDSAGNPVSGGGSGGAVSSSAIQPTAAGDGSVGTAAETITVASGTQSFEFFNLGANIIWASWTGTAAAASAGSFPIPAYNSTTGQAGYYSAPSGLYGSFSIIAASGTSAFTAIRGA